MSVFPIHVGPFFGLIFIVLFPIMLFVSIKKHRNLGKIKCNRCGYIGYPKTVWTPFKGFYAVCPKCGSENWTSIDNVKERINNQS